MYYNDIIIYIGKNERGNEEICRMCHPESIWFHLKDESSPHIILEDLENLENASVKTYKPIISQLMHKYKKNVKNKSRIIYTILKNVTLENKIGSVIPLNVKVL